MRVSMSTLTLVKAGQESTEEQWSSACALMAKLNAMLHDTQVVCGMTVHTISIIKY